MLSLLRCKSDHRGGFSTYYTQCQKLHQPPRSSQVWSGKKCNNQHFNVHEEKGCGSARRGGKHLTLTEVEDCFSEEVLLRWVLMVALEFTRGGGEAKQGHSRQKQQCHLAQSIQDGWCIWCVRLETTQKPNHPRPGGTFQEWGPGSEYSRKVCWYCKQRSNLIRFAI